MNATEYHRKWVRANPEKVKLYCVHRKEKQAVYYKKWYAKNGRTRNENYVEQTLEYQAKYPNRIKTQHLLQYAIKKGEYIRPDICPRCGNKAKIQAHHINYRSYKNFVWLCASCHKKEHLNKRR